MTVAPALLVKTRVTTAPVRQVPLAVAVAPVISDKTTVSSPAILALMTGAGRLSMVMVLLPRPEVMPARAWLALTVTLPAPKVASSAAVRVVTLQAPLLTVAVLLTDWLALLVNLTVTVAPVKPVPLTVAVLAKASLQLTLSLPAIGVSLKDGAANEVKMVTA